MTTSLVRGGGAGGPHHRIRACEGMVTAEFALGILGAVPVLVSLVLIVGLGAVQVQLVEGARTAARMLAREDPESQVRAYLQTAVPQAEVTVERGADGVVVHVGRRIRGAGLLPDVTLTGRAVTVAEDPGEE